jgi:hypothetical protein
MLLTQQISKSEYLEMLNDLATEKNINETAQDLEGISMPPNSP